MENSLSSTSSSQVARVLTDAMALSEDQRLDVATELLASLNGPDAGLDDDAWLAELRRRAERVEQGQSRSVTWDEAKRSVLETLRAR